MAKEIEPQMMQDSCKPHIIYTLLRELLDSRSVCSFSSFLYLFIFSFFFAIEEQWERLTPKETNWNSKSTLRQREDLSRHFHLSFLPFHFLLLYSCGSSYLYIHIHTRRPRIIYSRLWCFLPLLTYPHLYYYYTYIIYITTRWMHKNRWE